MIIAYMGGGLFGKKLLTNSNKLKQTAKPQGLLAFVSRPSSNELEHRFYPYKNAERAGLLACSKGGHFASEERPARGNIKRVFNISNQLAYRRFLGQSKDRSKAIRYSPRNTETASKHRISCPMRRAICYMGRKVSAGEFGLSRFLST
jgi:hypothetical protein